MPIESRGRFEGAGLSIRPALRSRYRQPRLQDVRLK
jgi:hypothetical protein